MQSHFRISAVGDISFAGRNADKPSTEIFKLISPIFKKSDLVVGNLEGPLFDGRNSIMGKCTIRGCTRWAKVLRDTGFDILSLANNHIMDHGEAGLLSTIRSLEQNGLVYLGAGKNRKDAYAPKFIDAYNLRLAFLARTSVIVSSPCYAEENKAGVAFLDVSETKEYIKLSKKSADIVILLIHWGIEDYVYPTPEQRYLANEFIDGGADIILGHHPHVIQGIEQIKNSLVAYSLGNFLFDEFEWTLNISGDKPKKQILSLSAENRKGVILNILCKEKHFELAPVFTHIDVDREARVTLDSTLNKAHGFTTLSEKFRLPYYKYWWRIYSLKKEWNIRIKPKLSFRNLFHKIQKIRFRHFKELFSILRRSAKITTGKTTNPYD